MFCFVFFYKRVLLDIHTKLIQGEMVKYERSLSK